jgi:hypothetical protein
MTPRTYTGATYHHPSREQGDGKPSSCTLRLGGPVINAVGVEVGEELGPPRAQGAAEPGDLRDRAPTCSSRRSVAIGHGFRNFDNYRLRLLLHCGAAGTLHSRPESGTALTLGGVEPS